MSSATTPGRVHIALAALAAMSVIAALLFGGLVALAQGDRGAVPNLRLSSASPGELTISWDAPDPAPSDYRVNWAEQSLGFLSYKNSNEAGRGNEYPSGEKRSITLTGLTKGETFKVMARARYTSGGRNNGPWSGPWTDTVTARVKDDPPAAPTGLTASQVAHDSVTLTWTAPSRGTVTGYRILRGTDANSLSVIAQDTGGGAAEYTDSTVAAETTYHYAVLALSTDGDGEQSSTVSATTPPAPQQEEPQRQSQQEPKATPEGERLQRAAGDATGVPAITVANVWRVPGVVTANKGTIADTDGLPAEMAFTWQWVRVDGANETDITGATAATYTLTDDDAGKTIKVKARFTDNGGNAEGPLTSAATSTITAAATCNAPSYPAIEKQIWTGKVTVHALLSNPRGLPQFRGFKSGSEQIFATSFRSGGELRNLRLTVKGGDYSIETAG